MTDEEREAYEVAGYLNRKGQEFDQLCVTRHTMGAEEYGATTFLGNDVVRMMLEELADISNYCRMQAVKLLILQERLELEMDKKGFVSEDKQNVELGFQAFKGTKEGWKR